MVARPGLVTCVLIGATTLLFACSAVLGLHDIQQPDDAGTHADGAPASDVTQPADGPTTDGPADTGHADAANLDGGDAGDGASCVAVTTPILPRAGGPGCPTEASACYPHDLTTWMPQWSAALGPKAGACSSQQIDTYYADCRGPSWSPSLCGGFGADPQNSTCIACMETTVGAGRWGVVIVDALQNWLNVAGCIALVEPCNLPCAEAMTAQVGCYTDACGPSCAGSSALSTTQCEQDSVTACTTCSQFLAGASCFTQILGTEHPAYALCGMSQAGTHAQFTAVATMICGS